MPELPPEFEGAAACIERLVQLNQKVSRAQLARLPHPLQKFSLTHQACLASLLPVLPCLSS